MLTKDAEIFSFFPKVFFKKNLKIKNINFKKILKEIKFTPASELQPNTSASSVDKYVLDNNISLKDVKLKIIQEFNNFKNNILRYSNNEFKLTTSWFTEAKPYQESLVHRHKNCFYSGVYYIDVPKESAKINFFNYTDSDLYLVPQQSNAFNSDGVDLIVNTGDLIFFPSNIYHKIPLNKSKHKRYSLAFNFFPTGVLGQGDSQLII
jgi:uncharacterized protein (TIGR02466 family)